MIKEELTAELFRLQDKEYREFLIKLIPTVDPETVIGVRTPDIRRLAAQAGKTNTIDVFLSVLPHRYFEEKQLHAFIVSGIKDFGECLERINCFLPYVDNWATCDQMSPRVFAKHKAELLAQTQVWLRSDETYTVRFAIGMLMQHFLGDEFDRSLPESVSRIRRDEYYVKMMVAWYFATALAKQYDSVIPFIENKKLDGWTHNKAIQKAIESRRITDEQKEYLRSLKV